MILAIYSGGCADREREFLLVGDSIMRFVEIPNGITYCWPGAKILDMVKLIPVLTDIHTTTHTIIIHVGTNNIRLKQSIKPWSLGKLCILSGLIPSESKGCENVSRLFSAHQWLLNFCIATGITVVNNFDYFFPSFFLPTVAVPVMCWEDKLPQ